MLLSAHATMKILLADDSSMIRDRLKVLASEIPKARVIGEATDAQEAIEKTITLKPSLVILDFQIPGASGLSTLQTIKALPSAPIVVILTAFSTLEYRARCQEAGADYFFDKALEIDKVQDTLLKLIQ